MRFQIIYISEVEAPNLLYVTEKYLPQEGLPADIVSVKVVEIDETLENDND